MQALMLQFDNGEDLDVRSFRIREAVSRPFKIELVARSTNHDLNFETMVGQPAVFRLTNGAAYVDALWWGAASDGQPVPTGTFDVAAVPQVEEYNGRRSVRLRFLAWRPTAAGDGSTPG